MTADHSPFPAARGGYAAESGYREPQKRLRNAWPVILYCELHLP